MRLDERWLWLGEAVSARDAGVTIFQAHPGAWWIAVAAEMIGPFGDRCILRAVRVACSPTIDGCERGPAKLGVSELVPRQPLRRGPAWQEHPEAQLPPSVTTYDRRALDPVVGCCTTDDAPPKVTWGEAGGWDEYLDARPARGGALAAGWNAHPPGALIYALGMVLESGFVIVDLPGGTPA
ncbi:MAG: hypothetical protein IT371_28890 [Deltaproteobacteria bacterium]|nr:hypothetical protein [Deltaproteobacteria bacterium]